MALHGVRDLERDTELHSADRALHMQKVRKKKDEMLAMCNYNHTRPSEEELVEQYRLRR